MNQNNPIFAEEDILFLGRVDKKQPTTYDEDVCECGCCYSCREGTGCDCDCECC